MPLPMPKTWSAGASLPPTTWRLTPGADLIDKAASFAVGQTVGTWTEVPGITREMLERHMARIVAVYDLPPVELAAGTCPRRPAQRSLVQIAFPEANFGAQFPMLLTTLLGQRCVDRPPASSCSTCSSRPAYAAGVPGPTLRHRRPARPPGHR